MKSIILFKRYYKVFIYLFFLVLFNLNPVLSESKLPKCKGKDYTKYKNCFGSYINKDISKSDQKDKITRDYTGEFGSESGIREGNGSSIVYENGQIIQKFVGEFLNDKVEGFGVSTRYYNDGFSTEYVGEFKDGQSFGQGTLTTSDGSIIIGNWKGMEIQGIAVVTYEVSEGENRKEYIGELDNYAANGNGTLTFVDGDQYIGEFKNNLFHGIGTYTWIDGKKYIGEWIDDNRTGQGTYLNQYGEEIYSGYWAFNKWNGIGKMTNTDGSTYIGKFLNDKFEGQGTYTWKDGSKYVGKWKNGQRDGKGTYINSNGVKKDQEWENGKQVDFSTKKSEKKDINLEEERKRLEEELKKLEEEKNKAKQAADKINKIKEQQEKIKNDSRNSFFNLQKIESAQYFIKELQEFIKQNPDEFDILEISELMIKNKVILEDSWKEEDKFNFFELTEYTFKSNKFRIFFNTRYDQKVEQLIYQYDLEVKKVEENIEHLKKYLQENLTSKAAEKIVLHIRSVEKVFNDPTPENLKKINKETNKFIKSLGNSKNKQKSKKTKKSVTKSKSISEKKSSIKGSPKEKIMSILKVIGHGTEELFEDIKFSRNEKSFIIYNLLIGNCTIEKIEVENLNKLYLEGIFEAIVNNQATNYFNSYNGKFFDEIKFLGIEKCDLGNELTVDTAKEIVMTNLDFKKFDIINKLINSNIDQHTKNLISFMMSMSWDDFYAKDLQIYDQRDSSEVKYDYFEMSDFKELSINKLLINNTSIVSALDTISIKKVLIEKLILDQAEILSFLNSDASGSSSFLSKDYSSYLQNGLKSLRNFEISDISMSDNESRRKFLDINSLQLNNVKFDYLGDKGNKKIPISFEFNIDEVDYNYKNVSYGNSMLRDLELAADTLNYDAIKFKFGGKWDWNTRRNNLSINLDLGASDAISLKLKSSFVDLSTDFLNLTGAPLATYFMTQPKLKSLDISLNDNSLKNRLIESYAESENMTSEQTKDFVVQSLDIFITTLGIKNSVVENLQESLNKFIYDSNNLTLSANPSKPVSFTDLMPDFTSPDANQVINKLNLKMSNRLF